MIRAAAIWLMLTACAASVNAQTTSTPEEKSPPIVFLPRAAFHMTAEHLSGDEPRFVWDATFGGDLDLVGYDAGRATFYANYEAILGEEIRAFDPNQGNYILGGFMSVREAGVEIAGVFHHESRHLSDRFKRVPVNWNMFGGRVMKQVTRGQTHLLAHADLRGVVQKSFVDYRWELATGIRSDVTVAPHVAAISTIDIQFLGVDGTEDRGTQTGVRAEGGMRFEGKAGAIEVFLAAERRIDPYPLEFSTARWVTVGFRLLSR